MLSIRDAVMYTFIMGAVIFLCRAFAFILLRGKNSGDIRENKFLTFVEKIVPPVAMTVLAFNTVLTPTKDNPVSSGSAAVIAASIATALLHLWKRNSLISIFSGTFIRKWV